MTLMQWAFGGQRGPARRRGVVLQLSSCEDRLVPDGALPAPPAGWESEAQTAPSETFSATVQAGEWVYAGQVGGLDQWFTVDSHSRQWLFSAAPGSGAFNAVLINYDGSYDPTEHPLTQANFEPDAGKWNLVWNPDDGTWTTEVPGTVFPTGVSGFTAGEWNYVHLSNQQPRPPILLPPPTGGATITIAPGDKIVITTPNGTKITITPLPGGGIITEVTPPGGNNPPPPRVGDWIWGGALQIPPYLDPSDTDCSYFGVTDFPGMP